MSTNTPNINLEKPTVGGDSDLWGGMTNGNWDLLDDYIANKMYPIDSLYFSVLSTNPNTLLGFGVWESFAEGRALVGVGTADSEVWTVEEEKGAATHVLTEAETAAHSHDEGTLVNANEADHDHGNGDLTASSGGSSHTHTVQFDYIWANEDGSGTVRHTKTLDGGGNYSGGNVETDSDGSHSHDVTGRTGMNGDHTHAITGATGFTGAGDAHNNIQPSVAVYIWKRTA